ncbi:MAG TPA: two-component regulator propeller domain-containing protein, partial [Segetibacter sp.]
LLLQCLFFSTYAIGQNLSPKFIRLTTNEGLSQGHVNATIKDKKGFMWFCTNGGLNKYDGYKFTAYKHDPDNPHSISNDIVSDVVEDEAGNLWVGTRAGLDKFDRKKETFAHYLPENKSVNINRVYRDSKKRIWVCSTNGLYLFDPKEGKFLGYRNDPNNSNSLSENTVADIEEDSNGEFWIGTKKGLNRFNPSTNIFKVFLNDPKNNNSISGDWIRAVHRDSRGNIWSGTVGYGVSVYNPKNNSFKNYRHNPKNANTVALNDILSFCEFDKDELWIGTENGGVSVFNYANNTFKTYKNNPFNDNSLSNNSIYSIYKDDIGNMWIGTYSEGVNLLQKNGDKFVHYKQILTEKNGLSDHNILTIAGGTNSDYVWLGTDGGGLNRFNKTTKEFKHYLHDDRNKNSINSNYVLAAVELDKNLIALGLLRGGLDLLETTTGRFTHHSLGKNDVKSFATVTSLYKSRGGDLWIGTWGGGLNLYNYRKRSVIHYENNPSDTNSIASNFSTCLLEDSEGNLWSGSSEGLDKLDKETNTFIHYRHFDKDKKSLSQNYVQSLFEDRAKNLWIGTTGGLNLFDRKTKTFVAFTEKNGLASNMIQSIREDRQGNLWLATNSGLTKFNPITKSVRNYQTSDGLQSKEFKPNSSFQASDGEMYFGGINGFNTFYPDSLKDNQFKPPVYLTNFQVFNKDVLPSNENSPLVEQISEAKEIVLSYDQSVFSFEFAALNYTLPQKNQYAYKLKNFDKEWIYSGNKHTATYTHLDPGEYVFSVMGTNNDGLWNEKGTSVVVKILPPFWLTWWFKMLMICIVLGSAVMFYSFRVKIINDQKNKLEQKVREQTVQLLTSNEEERKARLEADQANRAKSV